MRRPSILFESPKSCLLDKVNRPDRMQTWNVCSTYGTLQRPEERLRTAEHNVTGYGRLNRPPTNHLHTPLSHRPVAATPKEPPNGWTMSTSASRPDCSRASPEAVPTWDQVAVLEQDTLGTLPAAGWSSDTCDVCSRYTLSDLPKLLGPRLLLSVQLCCCRSLVPILSHRLLL